ncbi:MAG: hypothetical protein A3J70_01625 [Elusimicrobia bacterium RIFCSPHIGHO2_02_FULL_61_10]|nr:MAG: hypothetical protein A3J70_01625 [Elusimicrobia bacterium RIFCSPHIGHO2_02_FULL_61_10]
MSKAWNKVKKTAKSIDSFLKRLEDENPDEPFYDPVHLGAVLIVNLVVVGALYWLLWTLLVYEGGIFVKISAGFSVLLTSKTPADYGYRGSPYAMGAFEGWMGNVMALALTLLVIAALHRLYHAKKQS